MNIYIIYNDSGKEVTRLIADYFLVDGMGRIDFYIKRVNTNNNDKTASFSSNFSVVKAK